MPLVGTSKGSISLKKIALLRDRVPADGEYPFSIPAIRGFRELDLRSRVCFFVGENGTGKSTLLEAIAYHAGFGPQGGSRNMGGEQPDGAGAQRLAHALRLSWSRKQTRGWFLRAESFFNICTQLDQLGPTVLEAYGGVSLHQRSHGEAFLALFANRFSGRGLYLMDEPEAALSPQRQLSFLLILDELLKSSGEAQAIVASHSPIILAFPEAQIVSFDGDRLCEIPYEETPAYRILSGFVRDPRGYVERLLREE